jgi:hypothetical protein
MRSSILKPLLVAIFASTALVGANAASHGHDRDHHGSREFQPPGEADGSGYFDHMTMGPPSLYPVPTVTRQVVVASRVVPHQARLARIENAVSGADRRVVSDRARGLVTRTEARNFISQAAGIRADAGRIASQHRGAVPEGWYEALQQRLQRLDQAVDRAATA